MDVEVRVFCEPLSGPRTGVSTRRPTRVRVGARQEEGDAADEFLDID